VIKIFLACLVQEKKVSVCFFENTNSKTFSGSRIKQYLNSVPAFLFGIGGFSPVSTLYRVPKNP
jgi:hypothetical protein